ncbi:MAG: GNAT family N-acetyltransferase [Planctomycetes bacterium]|nr:GNAT family N-acetyltransferase [Planctomycetota bacterium]
MKSSSNASSATPANGAVRLRPLSPADRAPIERILRATGVFRDDEIDVALELVDARPEVGYRFVVAELAGAVAGYACFGATPMTLGTWDLYWIAVDPALHGRGVGTLLMRSVEDAIRAEGGRLVMIETASKPSYTPTRRFYERHAGCREVARVPDFYAIGDDKVMYAIQLGGTR